MLNPNNCSTCKHKKHPDGGWCYMFRDEPSQVCMQHSGRTESTESVVRKLLRQGEEHGG